jgi:thymidylate synthase (FAD)
MKVELIAICKPVNECETAEELIAYCARVSNPTNQNNKDTASKLLTYLKNNKHWSPFEMVHLTIGITTTRDIARQILRHRSFAFQEFSQRYAEATEFVTREARLQDTKNRQASIEINDEALESKWQLRQNTLIIEAEEAYKWALKNGIAKEQARAVLPEGNTVSRLYVAGSLRSWIHYIELRTDMGTQKEHREIAEACKQIIRKEFPSLYDNSN